MGEVDLMALYWTVSGPVEVHVGREWSLFDWRDRCAEAAKVGFEGSGCGMPMSRTNSRRARSRRWRRSSAMPG